jgi:hypothetical protein
MPAFNSSLMVRFNTMADDHLSCPRIGISWVQISLQNTIEPI